MKRLLLTISLLIACGADAKNPPVADPPPKVVTLQVGIGKPNTKRAAIMSASVNVARTNVIISNDGVCTVVVTYTNLDGAPIAEKTIRITPGQNIVDQFNNSLKAPPRKDASAIITALLSYIDAELADLAANNKLNL